MSIKRNKKIKGFCTQYIDESRLSSIKVDKTTQGLLADRTELGMLVGTHSAILKAPIYAMYAISGSLVHTYFIFVLLISRGWYGCFLFNQVFPFAEKCFQGRNILLPWLNIVWIHRNLFGIIGVFICQSCKAVPELMHYNGLEKRVMGRGQVVRI